MRPISSNSRVRRSPLRPRLLRTLAPLRAAVVRQPTDHAPRRLSIGLAAVLGLAACRPVSPPTPTPAGGWVGTWATSQQLVEPGNMPPPPGLSGKTLRQVVHTSIGGRRLRVRVSNVFGTSPLTISSIAIAPSLGGSAIDGARQRALAFGGRGAVTIAPGRDTLSDPLDFALAPLTDVALTTHFAGVPAALTGHPGSRTTSYVQPGDAVGAPSLPSAVTTAHWYVIAGIDVEAGTSAAVVALGNSITDGRGSGTDRQNRWPDELARRLQASEATRGVAVLNAGIGGNCVLRSCLGPSALARLERDVLAQAGVRWLIVLEGVNDIGQAKDSAQADSIGKGLMAAYRQIVERSHARGIRVFGATILPFGGSFYDAPHRERARSDVNRWIRTSGVFDAVVDLDAVMRDPANPTHLASAGDGGDHLHPNEAGYRTMAEAIDLRLFTATR